MANKYTMIISRLIVDKLGVKLYDKVSAVIAELISNSYDGDATSVEVCAPMGQFLASKSGGGTSDKGFTIVVKDNGIGMVPKELQDFFLIVGAERRNDPKRGELSRKFQRKVMGRKGVGKLAPFGICKVIEVISAGGDEVEGEHGTRGFLTAHIKLNYDVITAIDEFPDDAYEPEIGEQDGSLSETAGTTIILREFNFRQVPNIEVLSRQLSQRFGIPSSNWQVALYDNTKTDGDEDYHHPVGEFGINTMPNTKIAIEQSLDGRYIVADPDGNEIPGLKGGFDHEGEFYPVTGWMAYSRQPYRDDLMAGIRIYCRGKIAAQTNLFGKKAGFTGEYDIRSYLVGELVADWLDQDNDLIQTDRRDILWSDELGQAFQEWGQEIVQHIGRLSRNPMRLASKDLFFRVGKVAQRIEAAYPAESENAIRLQAIQIAEMFGKSASKSEAGNPEVVKDLVDMSINLAPHITLDEMTRQAAESSLTPLNALTGLLRTARFAELASFGRIAENRLKVMDRLEGLKDDLDTPEDSLQHLLVDAPWLINPEWAPITQNQSLNTLRKEFQKFYNRETGEDLFLGGFDDPNRRPDFVLSSQDGIAQIIEIKKPGHSLKDVEADRIVKYHINMANFLADPANEEFKRFFNGFHITLVCDELSLTGAQKLALEGIVASGKLTHIDWKTFLLRAENVHRDFLAEATRQHSLIVKRAEQRK